MEFQDQLKNSLFFPLAPESHLATLKTTEYKVEFSLKELTKEKLMQSKRTQRIYSLVRDKSEATFKLKRIKIDSNGNYCFGRWLYLEQLSFVSFLNANQWGPICCFQQWTTGKRFVWECEDHQGFVEFVEQMVLATLNICNLSLEKLFPNLETFRSLSSENHHSPSESQKQLASHESTSSSEKELTTLAVEELFGEDEQIDLQHLDIEMLQAKWIKAKRTLSQNKANYLLNLSGKTDEIADKIKQSSCKLEEIREIFKVVALHSKSLEKDVQYLRTYNDALAIETKNQKAIYSTLESLVHALELDERSVNVLKNEDFSTLSGSRSLEEAFFTLVEKLSNSLPEELGLNDLAAVKERQNFLLQVYNSFYQRFADFFKRLLNSEAQKMLQDKNRFPKRGKPLKLTSHDEFCNILGRYAEIISRFHKMTPDLHKNLVDFYCSIIYPVYQKEVGEFLDEISSKSNCILKRHLAGISFDCKPGQTIKNVSIEYNTVFTGEIKYPPHSIWEYILKMLLPILYQEKNALDKIFHLSSQNQQAFGRLTSLILPKLQAVLEDLSKADSSFLFKMLVETENGIMFLEESDSSSSLSSSINSSYLLSPLLNSLCKFQMKFIQEQATIIREQGKEIVKCKKIQNLIAVSWKFVEFVVCISGCLRGIGPKGIVPTLSMETAIENSRYLLQEIFTIWKPLEVHRDLLLNNCFFILQKLRKSQRNCNPLGLFPFLQEELEVKFDFYLERSAKDFLFEASSRLIKHFDQMVSLMRYYDVEEIAFHPSFSKWRTKRFLDEYSDERQLKGELEDLRQQIFKCFSEELLGEIVWKRVEMEFEQRFERWNSLLSQVYPTDPSMKFSFSCKEVLHQANEEVK